jgi:ribosomal protein S18 acetylase RimI-like enzyme
MQSDVTLVPVPAELAGAVAGGDLSGLTVPNWQHGKGGQGGLIAARGWPHEDTVHGLAFLEAGGMTWLVLDGDGLVVGELGTKGPPSADGEVEIGYGLAGPSRGRGLGTRAVGQLVELLFARPDVRRLEADVALDNLPSQRLLERLAFTCTGGDHRELHYVRDKDPG